jgi:hypothetical protein
VNANSNTSNDFDFTLDTSYGLQPSNSFGLAGMG